MTDNVFERQRMIQKFHDALDRIPEDRKPKYGPFPNRIEQCVKIFEKLVEESRQNQRLRAMEIEQNKSLPQNRPLQARSVISSPIGIFIGSGDENPPQPPPNADLGQAKENVAPVCKPGQRHERQEDSHFIAPKPEDTPTGRRNAGQGQATPAPANRERRSGATGGR